MVTTTSVDEDYRLGEQINRVAAVVHNVVSPRLTSLGSLKVLGCILEREIELNASKKEVSIKKLYGLVSY
ncbi:hypothetical protein Tco_0230699 [Tanacetum coccineum]